MAGDTNLFSIPIRSCRGRFRGVRVLQRDGVLLARGLRRGVPRLSRHRLRLQHDHERQRDGIT